MMAKGKLTPKQEAFVAEYLTDLNASAAAIRAGYASGDLGRQLLTKTHVEAAIIAAKQERQHRTLVRADRVVSELALVAFSDVGEVLDFSGDAPRLRPARDIPEAARRAISSVKVRRYVEGTGEAAREVEVTEFKLWSKLDALGKLMPHVGLKAPDESGAKPPPVLFVNVQVNHASGPAARPDVIDAASVPRSVEGRQEGPGVQPPSGPEAGVG